MARIFSVLAILSVALLAANFVVGLWGGDFNGAAREKRAAQAKLREIQGQWQDTGRLPRDASTALDRRLRAVDEKVRAAMDSAWRRTPVEESPLLTQMRAQVAEAQARLDRAKASGDAAPPAAWRAASRAAWAAGSTTSQA